MPEHYQTTSHSRIAETQHTKFSECTVLLWSVFILMALTTSVGFAQETEPDCQCRAPGGLMQDLGTVACFDIVGNKRMVRCEMSTNTPYWKEVEGIEGCPDA